MKKLTASVFAALMTIASVQTFAQNIARADHKEMRTEKKVERKALRKLEGTQVSQLAKDSFGGDFGKIKVDKWVRNGQFDEATFTKDGQKMTAFYGYDNKLVGTTTDKKFSDLPAIVQKEITKQYTNKGYRIGAVILYDDNQENDSDMQLYGTQFSGADHYFITVSKGGKETVLMTGMVEGVYFFKDLK